MAQYNAGYGDADISPPRGIRGRVGLSHRLELPGDPIAARALYLKDAGGGEVVLISVEVVGLVGEVLERVRDRVAEVAPLPRESVVVTATHTHAGPWVWTRQARDAAECGIKLLDTSWMERVIEACAEAALRARESAAPALLKAGMAEVREVASNRLEYGWRSSWTEDPELRARPVGSIDPIVRLLAICTPEGEPQALVANYACHPTAYGGGEVPFAAPDYPGFAERHFSRKRGRAVPLIYWMGCAGDINTGKFCAEGNDEEVAGFGVRLGEALLKAFSTATEVDGSLEIERELHHFEPGEWMEPVEEARARFEALSGPLARRLEAGESLEYSDYHEWRMALKRLDFCQCLEPEGMPVELIRLGLGPLQLLFVPGEWFHRIGLELMAEKPLLAGGVPSVWVTTLASFDLNYVPDPGSFARKEWYGVAPAVRILSDKGILDMIAAAKGMLE